MSMNTSKLFHTVVVLGMAVAAGAACSSTTGPTPVADAGSSGATSGGTSDGRFIADLCPEVVELGPVGASIHKIDERIRVADLAPLARIYERLLERLLVEG